MPLPDFYLIPKSGVTVRDPATGKPLPEAGANKPRSSYWLRRLRDGDVSEGKPPKAAKASTTSTGEGK
ncbi:DUF2635 domain-containing protein [Frateuria sp. YIM B11624]|uniref:DUF2635 domain-containing protein n=1 Tax=Frateuria sp. YIM B11624 TaxID=3143185 RepID=UPI003C7557A0